jgi:endonuclease/exonuclease/phosphatase family metal-dependent hydrolase
VYFPPGSPQLVSKLLSLPIERRFVRSVAVLLFVLIGFSSVQAGSRWGEVRTIEAPEAHQAAAVDEKFFYAISSTEVAKYDRETGQKRAVSRGEAKHLNSGFLWNGKLFCAHSNFPRTPEQSDIRVLDLESMELSVFHSFGESDGSLTWAIRGDRQWWCNFAKYGDQNGDTRLIRFDDEWRETGRWRYPDAVIRQLGRNSLSGGVWYGDELLCTGHDDPVLFRLRVPVEGDVLEFIGEEPVPFTGQGIAVDPASDRLVGIQRSKHHVVIAERSNPNAIRLRVLTYNIHHGEGVDGKLDLERIAGVIRSVEPDLVSLQEVDQNCERTGKVDQPAELARLTGMKAAFGGNIELQGGQYGNAVLSRFPIVKSENHKLPNTGGGEQRGLLEVEVEVELPGSKLPLLLLATHFDHRREDAQRIESVRMIQERLQNRGDVPFLLAGDLNDAPDSAVLKQLSKDWTGWRDVLPTTPVETPTRQIDFILRRPVGRWRCLEARVLPEAVASDHRAYLMILELEPSSP